MNKQEISELKRRLSPDDNNVTVIRGCYVNEKREIVLEFNRSPLSMPEPEAEKYLSIFKKALSGVPGKNLVEINFSASQVMDGAEHRLLQALRETALKDDALAGAFFDTVIQNTRIEGNYLILLMHDAYDVPFKPDPERAMPDESADVFNYVMACVCPVKLSKPALTYFADDNDFHARDLDWVVNSPEIGFVFPAFDDRRANIHAAVYFTRDAADNHDEFAACVFGGEAPLPAQAQKQAFQALLEQTLEDECDLNVITSVNESLRERVEQAAADKQAEPVKVGGRELKNLLEASGVSPERAEAFEREYALEFGEAADVSAVSLVETKQYELRTPDVIIRVAPDRADLIETRVIDGTKYILIRADDGVELNGVNLTI